MDHPAILLGFLGFSILLIAVFVLRPGITKSQGGKVVAFFVLFALPLFCLGMGFSAEMDRSKSTEFCLSCHIMEPYGKSLYVDDSKYIPAAHFQNHRVPAGEACYTCHTDYALYGGFRAKLRGLHHIWVQYVGTPAQPIHLYSPYNNRECLHCHAGARSFESPTHLAMMDSLKSNEISCLSSGCHDTVHNIGTLDQVHFWSPEEK